AVSVAVRTCMKYRPEPSCAPDAPRPSQSHTLVPGPATGLVRNTTDPRMSKTVMTASPARYPPGKLYSSATAPDDGFGYGSPTSKRGTSGGVSDDVSPPLPTTFAT